jgi:hypothetical protein
MDRAQAVNLLSQNAYTLREDLALMESGFVKCQSFGANVTAEQAARLQANLSRLLAIIDAFGGNRPDEPCREDSAPAPE